MLEGTVTNVAAFGAFVDIGVHQDGLVHVSALSKTFIKDPREVCKPGQVVKVKVLEIDMARKRVALTMRMDDPIPAASDRDGNRRDIRTPTPDRRMMTSDRGSEQSSHGGVMAAALIRAAKGRP